MAERCPDCDSAFSYDRKFDICSNCDASLSRIKLTKRRREMIMKRDGYRCVFCGQGWDLTIDHAKPVIDGGPNTFDNLQTLCRPCNSQKSDRAIYHEGHPLLAPDAPTVDPAKDPDRQRRRDRRRFINEYQAWRQGSRETLPPAPPKWYLDSIEDRRA